MLAYGEKSDVVLACQQRLKDLLSDYYTGRTFQAPCIAFLGDMGDWDTCQAMFREVKEKFGPVDVLVNNAGISYVGLLQDMKPEEWDRIIRTNLTSVFNCCRLVVPDMVSAKRGKIINISSVWGVCGASCEAAYSATKEGSTP